MSDKLTDRLAYREELVRQQQFLGRVIDSESCDPTLRADAQERFDEMSDWLLFADGPARQCNVLIAFQGHRKLVEDELAELPPEVVAEQVVYVTMARHVAELADTAMYSDDMRIECADTLMMLLTDLRCCAAEDLEYIE
jgi:hypothetical protein